jgi:hypothetical protein
MNVLVNCGGVIAFLSPALCLADDFDDAAADLSVFYLPYWVDLIGSVLPYFIAGIILFMIAKVMLDWFSEIII